MWSTENSSQAAYMHLSVILNTQKCVLCSSCGRGALQGYIRYYTEQVYMDQMSSQAEMLIQLPNRKTPNKSKEKSSTMYACPYFVHLIGNIIIFCTFISLSLWWYQVSQQLDFYSPQQLCFTLVRPPSKIDGPHEPQMIGDGKLNL